MVYVLLFILMILLDQYVKYIVLSNFFVGETIIVIPELFNFTYVQNRGMAFGLFQGKIDIVSILALVVTVGLVIYLIKEMRKLTILEKIGYTLILSGAVGNLIDRFYRGYVIDMLDVRGVWSFVFNLADVWINIGVFLIIIKAIFFTKKKKWG